MGSSRAQAAPGPELSELATDLRIVAGRLIRRLRRQAVGGLSVSQLSALSSVDRLGPLNLGALARVEGVAPPTLTRVVAHLEERGLVGRRPDPADRRAALVETTATGRRAITDVRSARAAYLTGRLTRLSGSDRATLAAAIEIIDRVLDDDDDPARSAR
jgi:DNA-binding MarR family transcriptional regulator